MREGVLHQHSEICRAFGFMCWFCLEVELGKKKLVKTMVSGLNSTPAHSLSCSWAVLSLSDTSCEQLGPESVAGSELQEHWADIPTATPKGTAAPLHQCDLALWCAGLHMGSGETLSSVWPVDPNRNSELGDGTWILDKSSTEGGNVG